MNRNSGMSRPAGFDGGKSTAGRAPFSARGVSRETNSLRSPRQLTFSEPLEPIRHPDAPLNIRRALVTLIFMGLISAAFIELAFLADFVSTFIQFP